MAKCTEHRIHSLLAFLSKGEKIHYIFLVLHIYQRKASASPKAQGPRDSCRRQAWYPFHTKMSLRCHQFALYTSHHPPLWPLVSKRQVFEKAPMGFQSLSAFFFGGGEGLVCRARQIAHIFSGARRTMETFIFVDGPTVPWFGRTKYLDRRAGRVRTNHAWDARSRHRQA